MTASTDDRLGALIAALVDLERHVAAGGWDQQPRLFALVHTEQIVAAEPELAARLGLHSFADGAPAHALTAVEQEDFHPGSQLLEALAGIAWPTAVFGCAVSLERMFLPAQAEADIPEDPVAAADFVGRHSDRQEIRVVVGVDREGRRHGVARLVSQPDELLGGPDLLPGLAQVLTHTLAAQ